MLNDPGLFQSNGNQNDDGWYIDRKDTRVDQTCYLILLTMEDLSFDFYCLF